MFGQSILLFVVTLCLLVALYIVHDKEFSVALFEDSLGSWNGSQDAVVTKEDLQAEKLDLLKKLLAVEQKLERMNTDSVAGPVMVGSTQPVTLSTQSDSPSSNFLLRDDNANDSKPKAMNSHSHLLLKDLPDSETFQQEKKIPFLAKEIVVNKPQIRVSNNIPNIVKPEKPVDNCKYSIKVYVYPLPSVLDSIRLGEEARRNGTLHICQKCILEQFALEYIIYDFFTQFCGRTYYPEEADFFYLPIIRDAEYRLTMELKTPRKRAPSPTEQALLDVIEKGNFARWLALFQVSDKYWKAHNGADHIIVMPAPVTNLRHESSKRGHFHYMLHLFPPIFLGLEYSSSFIREYPICVSQKNIVVPYPTTDPDLYNGKLLHGDVPRKFLIYYAGGVHGDCVEIRKAMKQVLANSTRLPGIVPDVRSIQSEREHGFRAAIFCPIPVGDSPSSKRMYDVMNFGCIPVVLSDDLVWAYDAFAGGLLNRSAFSIQMPQSVVQFTAEKLLKKFEHEPDKFGYLPDGTSIYSILLQANRDGASYRNGIYVNPLVQILERVSQAIIDYLQIGVAENAPHYRFYSMNSSMQIIPTSQHILPTGGAIDQLVTLLAMRKNAGIDNISSRCLTEKNSPGHKYLHRYPCEPNDRRRLMLDYFQRGQHMR